MSLEDRREQKRIYQREWHKRNPDYNKEACKRQYTKFGDRYKCYGRKYNLKKHFGLTEAQYDAMLEAQGGGCAICGAAASRNGYRLAVDHNHTTGQVRSLLCNLCNRKLGILESSWAALGAAYLEKHK